jgi:hypothetical protein
MEPEEIKEKPQKREFEIYKPIKRIKEKKSLQKSLEKPTRSKKKPTKQQMIKQALIIPCTMK